MISTVVIRSLLALCAQFEVMRIREVIYTLIEGRIEEIGNKTEHGKIAHPN
jgi:hypothetical protein